jgi:hypothetical protein
MALGGPMPAENEDNATSTFLFKITLQQPGMPVTVLYQPSQLMRQVKATYLKMLAQ